MTIWKNFDEFAAEKEFQIPKNAERSCLFCLYINQTHRGAFCMRHETEAGKLRIERYTARVCNDWEEDFDDEE